MPGVGEHQLARVQEDGLGGVARLRLGARVLQQPGDEVPEWVPGQISLGEVKLARSVSSS